MEWCWTLGEVLGRGGVTFVAVTRGERALLLASYEGNNITDGDIYLGNHTCCIVWGCKGRRSGEVSYTGVLGQVDLWEGGTGGERAGREVGGSAGVDMETAYGVTTMQSSWID